MAVHEDVLAVCVTSGHDPPPVKLRVPCGGRTFGSLSVSLTVALQTTPHWAMPKIKPKSADINDVVNYILTLRGLH